MKILDIFRTALIIGTLPNTLTNGTTADATQVMADLNKIVNDVNANAAPLSNTALLNATNNFTAVQVGIAATALVNFPIASQVQDWAFNTLSSTLGTNTITGRVAGMTISGYANGAVFTFLPTQTNTGVVTLNIDGVAARGIMLGGTNVSVGTIRQLIPVAVRYQDPVFHLISTPLQGYSPWAVYAPTVTLVGGAGNTVPVYTVNNGRWMQVGKKVSVDIDLSGDGGAEGAGTGAITIALPVAVGASSPSLKYAASGIVANSTSRWPAYATLVPSASTFTIGISVTTTSFPSLLGDDQNNTSRSIVLSFDYEVS